ncbi:hypothetical protein YC2023_037966 [Brassica napus]
MRVESIKARKKGEEPFDNAGNMNSPSGEQTSPCSSSTHTPEKWISRASEIDRDGGGVGEEGRDGGGGEATETAAIPVVEVSKSNRINPLGREREMREMRERQRHRVMLRHRRLCNREVEASTALPRRLLLRGGGGFVSTAVVGLCSRGVVAPLVSPSSVLFSLAHSFYSLSSRSMSRRFKASLSLDLSSETAAWKSEEGSQSVKTDGLDLVASNAGDGGLLGKLRFPEDGL